MQYIKITSTVMIILKIWYFFMIPIPQCYDMRCQEQFCLLNKYKGFVKGDLQNNCINNVF